MLEKLQGLFSLFGVEVAGLWGAVISALVHPDRKTRRDFAVFVLAGWACAYNLTTLAVGWLTLKPENANGIAFLLGAFGGSLILAGIKAIQAADLWGLVKARFGGGA